MSVEAANGVADDSPKSQAVARKRCIERSLQEKQEARRHPMNQQEGRKVGEISNMYSSKDQWEGSSCMTDASAKCGHSSWLPFDRMVWVNSLTLIIQHFPHGTKSTYVVMMQVLAALTGSRSGEPHGGWISLQA